AKALARSTHNVQSRGLLRGTERRIRGGAVRKGGHGKTRGGSDVPAAPPTRGRVENFAARARAPLDKFCLVACQRANGRSQVPSHTISAQPVRYTASSSHSTRCEPPGAMTSPSRAAPPNAAAATKDAQEPVPDEVVGPTPR